MGVEELFTSAFKALVELGGAGWLVAGLFLLAVISLYRDNGKIRDRAEAIGERTVIALERVGAVNQNVATTLDGSTKSREEMVRLLAEIARRTESDDKHTHGDLGDILKSVRDIVEWSRNYDRDVSRMFTEHKEIVDAVRANHLELVKVTVPRKTQAGE